MHVRQLCSSLLAFLILGASLIVSAIFVAQTRATSGANNEKELTLSLSGTTALASQTVTRNIYKPTIRIWIHGDSIRPSLIRATPGVVVLRAENETRSDVSLVVEKVLLGETLPVARIITTNGGRRARGELVVEAGEYIYYDAARPQIKGSLIVEVASQ